MEPTIYKPGAYKTPGVYKGTGGVYNGRGVYKDGGGSPLPPPPPGYTVFKYLENINFGDTVLLNLNSQKLSWNDTFEICLEFPNGIDNTIQWFIIAGDWYAKNGARFSNYGGRAIQSGWNTDFAVTPQIFAPNNDYNDFLDANKQIRIVENKDKIFINGVEYANTKGSETPSIAINATIQSNTSVVCRFIEMLCYDENMNLYEKIVPAKDPDGKSGILKLYSQVFRDNSQNFIAFD